MWSNVLKAIRAAPLPCHLQQSGEHSPRPLHDVKQSKGNEEPSPYHSWPKLRHCFWRRNIFFCTPQESRSSWHGDTPISYPFILPLILWRTWSPAKPWGFQFDKKHFRRRGTALWGKSSPATWGLPHKVEPSSPRITFLVISQSCPTISRRATRYHHMDLYRAIFSQTIPGKQDTIICPFLCLPSPAPEDTVRKFPCSRSQGMGSRLATWICAKRKRGEGRGYLRAEANLAACWHPSKLWVTHGNPEVCSCTREDPGQKWHVHTHCQALMGSQQSA